MRFFAYRQNNSGGSFDVDDNVNINVIIEANNADEADTIAESIGIYFNGCEDGLDCGCCGDRWSRCSWGCSGDTGDEVPSLYGEPLPQNAAGEYIPDEDTVIHYYRNNS